MQLHIKDVILLRKLHSFFGVGTIYVKENNNTVTYTVQSLRDITNIIIPHFEKYPLITNKKADYLLFKQGINLLNLKAHFELEGIREILSLKAAMNTENLSDMLKSHFPGILAIRRPEVSFEGISNPY
ncbi:LAGLIDADG family homing endonuclease (plasmid) [Peribacillus frigoritolerans]|nr:LAGLIDADG family homing endonuclease [Peribacillus frigoritolerans]